MMAKITTGSSFAGALNYDGDLDQKNGKIVTYLYSEGVDMNYRPDGTPDPDLKAMARSFELQAGLNPKVTKPVVHIALSFKPEDMPRLTNDYMLKIAKDYLQKMGFTNTQYVIHRHDETRNPHIHITLNRVDNDGNRISDQWERRRNVAVCQEITKREGLTWGDSKVISKSKVNDPTEKLRYQTARDVSQCLKRIRSIADLPEETARRGIETRIKVNENSGRIMGISFAVKDIDGKEHVWKGSELDRSLSAGNIMKTLRENDLQDKRQVRSLEEFEREVLKHTLFQCISKVSDIRQLPAETAKYGIQTHFRTDPKTGAIKGVSFSFEDRNGEDKTIKGSAIDRKLSAGNIAKMIDGEEYASSSVHGSESQLVLKEHLSFKEVLGEVTMALLDVAAQPTKSREHLDDIYFYGPGRRGRRPGYPGMRR